MCVSLTEQEIKEEAVVTKDVTPNEAMNKMNAELDVVLNDEPETQPAPVEHGLNDANDLLIKMAIDQKVDVDKLERLIGLKNAGEAREAKQRYDVHFAAMQADFKSAQRIKPGYGYNYAPLEEIQKAYTPIIAAHGFSYRWREEAIESGKRCILRISGWGHAEENSFDVPPLDPDPKLPMNPVQQAGAMSTYGRRYSFIAGFGVIIEDEDTDGVAENEIPVNVRATLTQEQLINIDDAIKGCFLLLHTTKLPDLVVIGIEKMFSYLYGKLIEGEEDPAGLALEMYRRAMEYAKGEKVNNAVKIGTGPSAPPQQAPELDTKASKKDAAAVKDYFAKIESGIKIMKENGYMNNPEGARQGAAADKYKAAGDAASMKALYESLIAEFTQKENAKEKIPEEQGEGKKFEDDSMGLLNGN